MLGVEPDIGSAALRLWVAAGSAALLVFVCAQAFDWTRTRTVARISVVMLGAVLGATLAWAFLDGASVRDQGAERRALETRAAELNAKSLATGSPLACLNGLAGDEVETACEKSLFAGPATVAAATTYVADRLSLLADMVAYTKRGGTHIDGSLLPLRRSLETDRFGFVAHTLAVRDGCTSNNCKALALLNDASHVRANLSGQTLDRYLDRYLTAWAQQAPGMPLADAGLPPSPAMAQQGALAPHKFVNIDFPSADSIPPISIMNPEPKGPPGAAAAAAEQTAHETPAASARRPARKQAATVPPPAPAAASAPAPSANQIDPVWQPRADQPAPAGAASAAPNSGGPVQLNPFPAPPQANAGGSPRAQ